jgi:hypothetical protein
MVDVSATRPAIETENCETCAELPGQPPLLFCETVNRRDVSIRPSNAKEQAP